MLKVLFILHYPPPIHGAAMVGEFIKNSKLVNKQYDTTYINLGLSQEVAAVGKAGFQKIRDYIKLLKKVYTHLKYFEPNICYITPTSKGIGLYKDLPVIAIAKCFKVKMVYHFHNKGVQKKQDFFFDNLLYRWMFKNVKVILLSKHLYTDVKKYVNEKNVYYCANGIKDMSSNSAPKTKHNAQQPIQLLFLSNLNSSKGIWVMLKACKRLMQQNHNFHCTFVGSVGDVSAEQFKTAVSELQLDNSVTYAGKKYGQEKEEVFKKVDIFVHPTLDDCVPLVILEAMQYNLPVISTYEGGIPDLVEDGKTGYLVHQNDDNELAERIKKLMLDQDLRITLGNAGRDAYERKFTATVFEQRLTTILKQIAN